ncbi:MAG: ATP-binding cassette subfamily B protein RaxB [Maricaulis maris]|jgi:ATP-binding cassette subfamily B protein RaxB
MGRKTPSFDNLLHILKPRRLPVVLATEAAECALACMVMIGRYHGHRVDLNGLRQRFPASIAGLGLNTLISIAEALGFATRALRVDLNSLKKVHTPAILHWNMNHFVVLERISNGKLFIHDPAVGRRVLSYADTSEHFTGVVLELRQSDNFQTVEVREPVALRSLWSKLTGFWPAFFQILILSIVLQVLVFAAPLYTQLVVDSALQQGDLNLLLVLALAFGAIMILRQVTQAIRAYTLQVLAQLLSFQMVSNLVRHLLRLKLDFFEKRHVGDIMSRVQSTQPIQDALSRGFVSTLIDGLMALIAIIIMAFYSGILTLIVLGSIVLSAVVTFAFYPIIRRRSEEAINAGADEQSHLMESVRGAQTIKAMGSEAQRESVWSNLFADTISANFSVSKVEIIRSLIQGLIAGSQTILVIYLAARLSIVGSGFSVGMLFAFLSYRQTFTDRATALINQAFQFRLLNLHLERISDIITAEREVSGGDLPALVDTEVAGRIECQAISFRYGTGSPFILNDLDLIVDPGEFVAITGPSGGGKSSLMKILLGFHAPTTGKLLLDDRVATPQHAKDWRMHTGVVMQQDRLMSGSISDNIAFFDPDIDMENVVRSAILANIHEDIARMPMKYLSVIGDMGAALSAGQVQRIMLARALYRSPKCLFLDEGTANLDLDTERKIGRMVADLPMTRVIVAHRPALIELADRVLLLENGKLRPL